ncbi:MAG: hypothetical protein JNL61_10405 [Rhizobiaceae bacterium]|nr:hypothetical protein [Rhizobiaceae bacterium]
MRDLSLKLALTAMALSATVATGWAQDAGAAAERFKKLLAAQGVELGWESLSGGGSDFVLKNVSVVPAGQQDKLNIGDVTFSDVEEADGGVSVGEISTQAHTIEKDGATIAISPFVLTGVHLPADGNTDPVASVLFYKQADLESVNVKMGDKQVFDMQKLHIDVTPPTADAPMGFTGSADSFTADLSTVGDPNAKAVLEALGYQTLSGDFEMAGTWQPADGRMALTQYDLNVNDAGSFGFTFDIGGYTPSFIKSLQDMQKQMAAQPAGADQSAAGLAILGLMQQLTFNTASIRYDDDSLTGKLLEYYGKQQGISAKDLANQIKALVPFGMAQLNNPELTASVSTAVNKFLDDPKSLEITAQPASAVPFALIMAGAMATPQDLPKTLGVTVAANED